MAGSNPTLVSPSPGRAWERWLGDTSAGPLDGRAWLILAIAWAASTVSLFLFRGGYAFPPYEILDSWVYTGYQWNLRGHMEEFGALYYQSRLTLILPGAILHHFLSPLAANVCYKLLESALLAAACAVIGSRARGLPTALLAVLLSVFCPQVICALHTDYMDMAVVLYGVLALAAITAAAGSRRWPAWIFLAGVAYTCMGISNLSALAMPGIGIVMFHLLWFGGDARRLFACVGIYLASAGITLAIAGGINHALGGSFHVLKPQVDMLFYLGGSEKNPWTPASWGWLKTASWLAAPAAALAWGAVRSFRRFEPNDQVRGLIRALTGGLAASLTMAVALELRGIGVLAYSFYASFQLCLAVPLLAICGTTTVRADGRASRWLLAAVAGLPLMVLLANPRFVSDTLHSLLFLSVPETVPVALLVLSTLIAGVIAVAFPQRARPELFLLAVVFSSMPVGFQAAPTTDRLAERYRSVHEAFRTLAREYPRGSYRFWIHPDQPDGISLASTMLYGYRLYTLQYFPKREAHNISSHTVVIPALPDQGEAVLKEAARILGEFRIEIVVPRIFPIRANRGIGMDLVCFSMTERPPNTDELIAEARQGIVVIDQQFSANPPYTRTIIQSLDDLDKKNAIDSSPGYPVYTRTGPGDYLWVPFQKVPNPGKASQFTLVVTMPVDGDCVCVIQDESYHDLRRIALRAKGRSIHTIDIPAQAKELRIYLTSENPRPTALPTAFTLYAPR